MNSSSYIYEDSQVIHKSACPGNEFFGTCLTSPNLIPLTESLVVELTVPSTVSVGFSGSNANGETPAALAAADVATDVFMLLCVERNPDIVNGLFAKVNSEGLTLPVQNMVEFMDTTDSSTNFSRIYNLNVSHGSNLQFAVAGLATSAESKSNRYNFYNASDARWSDVRMWVNGSALSDYALTTPLLYIQCKDNELKDSITPSQDALAMYGLIPKSFCGLSGPEFQANHRLVSGIDLTQQPCSLQVDYTKAASAQRAFLFCFTSRKLRLASAAEGSGIQVMNA
jgi:hypothetical protein